VTDLRRVTGATIVLLVLLRVSIGWQFLYEGLWKWDTMDSPKPWTSAGFLKNAQGPFRGVYRNMTGDPDDLGWLDYETVAARWSNWKQGFVGHYELDGRQKARLNNMVDGPSSFSAALKKLPEGVEITGRLGKIVKHSKGQLTVEAKYHLVPAERRSLLELVDVKEDPPGSGKFTAENAEHLVFAEAVHLLYARQKRLSYKEQLKASLLGDPERATRVDDRQKGTIDYKRIGKIEEYRNLLAEYEQQLSAEEQTFERDHLDYTWRQLQQMRGELVAPVRQMEADMQDAARLQLTAAQRALGAPPAASDPQATADWMAIISLVTLGILLIIGLGTRFAAVAGAGMLMSFYLVWPPFPGVPAAPGPEHSLFVNKNLIEIIALLALAFTHSGRWFGLDGVVRQCFISRKHQAKTDNPKNVETRIESDPIPKSIPLAD
jgi:uncharacterized membrane protein YphA (DoxX/SURF4 family)